MSASVNIGTIYGVLTLNDTFSSKMQLAVNQLDRTAAKIQKVGQAVTQVGDRVTTSISLPLGAASLAAFKFSSDFERNMVKVVTISGVSEKRIAQMRKEVLALGPAAGKGPKELSDALLNITSTGLRGAEAMEVLERSAKAGAVGLGETRDIAKSVVAAMTAYGKEHLNAAQATDILFAAVREGGADADEFAGTLGRVIGIASQVGVSFEEVATSVATFTRLGVDADEAVTALRGTLSVILKPSKDARDQLAALGTSIDEVRKSIRERGLAETLVQLVTLTKGNDDAIGAIVPNVRALAGVLGNAGSQAAAYREILDEVRHSTGDLDEAFEKTTKTSAFKFEQFWARVQVATIQAGDRLAPTFVKILDGLTPLFGVLERLLVMFGNLPQPAQTAAIALLGITITAGPLLSWMGRLIELMGLMLGSSGLAGIASLAPNVGKALGTVGTGLRSMAEGLGLITAASAAAPAMKAVSAAAEGTGKALKFAAGEQLGFTFGMVQARDELGRFLPRLWQAEQQLLPLSGAIEQTGFVAAASAGRFALLTRAVAAVGGVLSGPVGWILGIAAALATAGVAVLKFTGLWDPLTGMLSDVGRIAKNLVIIGFELIKRALQDLADTIARVFLSVWDSLTSALASVVGIAQEQVVPAFKAMGLVLVQTIPGLKEWVGAIAWLKANVPEWAKGLDAAADATDRIVDKLRQKDTLRPGPSNDILGFDEWARLGGGIRPPAAPPLGSGGGTTSPDWLTTWRENLTELTQQIDMAVRNHRPMLEQLELFGNEAAQAALEGKAFGVTVSKSVLAVAAAFKQAEIDKLAANADEQIRALAKDILGDNAKQFQERLDDMNKRWLKNAESIVKTNEDLHDTIARIEGDSLDSRLDAVRRDIDNRRRLLDRHASNYEDAIDGLERLEKERIREVTEAFVKGQEKTRAELQRSADEARRRYDMIRQAGVFTADAIYRAWEDLYQKERAAREASGVERFFSGLIGGLDQFTESLRAMGDIAGGVFSGFANWLGTITQATKMAKSSVDLIAKGIAAIREGFTAQGTADVLSGVAGGASSLAAATASRNRAAATAGGALSGASLGAYIGTFILPGLGTAAGAVIGAIGGAILGWWRSRKKDWEKVSKQISQDFGVQISEDLAKAIADVGKVVGKDAAPLLFLKNIFAEAGGVQAFGFERALSTTMRLFSEVAKGSISAESALLSLEAVFPDLAAAAVQTGRVASAQFHALIDQARTLGDEVQAITQFMTEQTSRFAGALGTMAGPLRKAFDEITRKLDELDDSDTGSVFQGLRSDLEDLVPEVDRFGRLLLAAFNSARAQGVGTFEAIRSLAPAFDQLVPVYERLKALGIDAGGAALQELLNKRALIEANQELLAAAEALNEATIALSFLNGLNVETLADLEAQGLQTYDRLRAAGFSEVDALTSIRGWLETIIESHYNLGIPIDENLQRLIDLAEQHGVLGDEALSMNDILIEGFAALIEAVGGELPEAFKKFRDAAVDAATRAKDAIEQIPTTIDVGVNVRDAVAVPGLEPGDWNADRRPATAMLGGRVAMGKVLPFTLGGLVPRIPQFMDRGGLVHFRPRGTDTVPAMLTPGEGIVSVRGMDRIGEEGLRALNHGGGAVGGQQPIIYLTVDQSGAYIDSERTADRMVEALFKKIRDGGHTLSEFQQLIRMAQHSRRAS